MIRGEYRSFLFLLWSLVPSYSCIASSVLGPILTVIFLMSLVHHIERLSSTAELMVFRAYNCSLVPSLQPEMAGAAGMVTSHRWFHAVGYTVDDLRLHWAFPQHPSVSEPPSGDQATSDLPSPPSLSLGCGHSHLTENTVCTAVI